jgi:hypothetical protein
LDPFAAELPDCKAWWRDENVEGRSGNPSYEQFDLLWESIPCRNTTTSDASLHETNCVLFGVDSPKRPFVFCNEVSPTSDSITMACSMQNKRKTVAISFIPIDGQEQTQRLYSVTYQVRWIDIGQAAF